MRIPGVGYLSNLKYRYERILYSCIVLSTLYTAYSELDDAGSVDDDGFVGSFRVSTAAKTSIPCWNPSRTAWFASDGDFQLESTGFGKWPASFHT